MLIVPGITDFAESTNGMTSTALSVGAGAPPAVDSSCCPALTKDDLIAFETDIAAEFNQAKILRPSTCTAATKSR